MKKLTHIAAPVAMTALLAACAAPGTLENLGPGELAEVQQSVVEALINEGPDGGLSPVQQAAEDALTKPGPVQQAVQQAVNDAVDAALNKRAALTRQMVFDFSGLDDPSIADDVKEMMKTVLEEEKKGHHLDTTTDRNRYILTGQLGVLTKPYRDSLIEKIKSRVPKGIGVPIRGDEGEEPVRFETTVLSFATIKGDPKSHVDISCDPVTYVVSTGVDAAPTDQAEVYDMDGSIVASEREDDKVIIRVPVHYNHEKKSCPVPEASDAAPITKFIMVYSIDRGVAQYHKFYPSAPPGERIDTADPEFTIGKPACPPMNWPDEVKTAVKARIGDCQPV